MGKVIKKQIQGMSWLSKTSLVLLLTLTSLVFMYEGWYKPRQIQAAVAELNTWINVSSTAPAAISGNVTSASFTPTAGANRVLLVGVTLEVGTGNTTVSTMDVRLDNATGTPFRLIRQTNATSNRSHAYMGYLLESEIPAGAHTIYVGYGLGANTVTGLHVNYATFSGVDQAAPINSSGSAATATTAITFGSIINYVINGMTTYIATNGGNPATMTPPAGFTQDVITTTSAFTTATATTAFHAAAGSYAAATGFTWGGTTNARSALVVASLNPAPTGDVLTASANTITTVTSPQYANATGLVMQRFQVAAGTNSIELNSLTLDDLGSAAGTVATARVYISPTSSLTLPVGAVQIGATAAGWAGTSTAITLGSGTAADRTVTTGTPKYIYIVYDLDNTQATRTIQSSVTALGVVAPDSVTAFTAMNSIAVTLDPPPSNALTVSANTPLATTASDVAAGVVMQRLQLDSNNVADSKLVLSSVTIDDNSATATGYANARIYISPTSSTTLPVGAVQIGSQASFSGASTTINLTGGTAADRTVTNPTSKYLYIVYDMLSGQTTRSVQSRVTAVAVVSPDTGATGLSLASNAFQLTPGISATIATCGGCHGDTTLITDGSARNTPLGRFQGSHSKHVVGQTQACSVCHIVPATTTSADFNHSNGQIQMASPLNNGSYSKATPFAVSNTFTPGTCNGTSCHAPVYATTPGVSISWGTPGGGCSACHSGVGTFINYSTPAAGNAATPQQIGPNTGSHSAHINYGRYVCQRCHDGALTQVSGGLAHGNGLINVTGGQGGGYTTGVTKHTAGTGYLTCTTACHTTTVPTWGQLTLKCINCHAAVITRTKGRPGTTLANAVAEFGLAWGHKSGANGTKTARATVTDADCIVCHLEGNFTTQQTAKYHADGNIDLRSPDVQGETPITNIAGAAWTFQRFSTSYVAGSKTPTGHTAEKIDNIITQKFCLACHDIGGAANTTARTASGTATNPFNVAGANGLGANYTVANGAAVAGGLVNVNDQFATTNTSVHPVRGPRNKDYPTAARLVAPYDNIAAGRTDTGHVLVNSVVISCFDCHNQVGTPLTRRTIVAHGNAVTKRGTIYVDATPYETFCDQCHTGYKTATNDHTHGLGSAGTTGAGGQLTGLMTGMCARCHASQATYPTRPLAAQDIHGNSNLVGGGTWTGSAAPGGKVYGFIRNTANFIAHRPYRSAQYTAGNPTCQGDASHCAGKNTTATYTPGGTY